MNEISPGLVRQRRPKLRDRRRLALRESKRVLWESLPELITSAVTKAKDGSAPHLKLLLELGAMEKGALLPASSQPREKTLETILLEQWARDKEDELAEAERLEERLRAEEA